METVLSVLVGLGLSAACGFRVFVPLLVAGVASRAGHLHLAEGFAWMGSDAALIALSVATVLEIVAYYVPWLDNFLDSVATPAAVVAGTLITASMITDTEPFLKWTLAAIAGGGLAGVVQVGTVVTRGASTATTGGLANPVVATAELGSSVAASLLSLVVPLVVVITVVGVVGFGSVWYVRRQRQSPAPPRIAPAQTKS